jgi:hypothetical protein
VFYIVDYSEAIGPARAVRATPSPSGGKALPALRERRERAKNPRARLRRGAVPQVGTLARCAHRMAAFPVLPEILTVPFAQHALRARGQVGGPDTREGSQSLRADPATLHRTGS